MGAPSGWVVIYRAKNGWRFRSKPFSSRSEATKNARLQHEREVFAAISIVGPTGQTLEVGSKGQFDNKSVARGLAS